MEKISPYHPFWLDLLSCSYFPHPIAFLKTVSLLWNVKIKTIAEIGVYRGISSIYLRQLFPEAHLYLIDPWEIYSDYKNEEAAAPTQDKEVMEKAYHMVISLFGNDPQTTIMRHTSQEASDLIAEPIDLILIDGNHSYSYVKQDITLWQPKIRSGGLIAGHDYNSLFPGVMRAVDEAFNENIVFGPNNYWIHQKLINTERGTYF
ncbi:MAG: class I SAM-dependent methyltransferase [Simkaniaceae bacterium]|nr:class I SAM-dependent methyltransferase [Simkaniaceae bacterium]